MPAGIQFILCATRIRPPYETVRSSPSITDNSSGHASRSGPRSLHTFRLTLKRKGSTVLVSWLAIWAGRTLKQNTNLTTSSWTGFNGPIDNGRTTQTAANSLLSVNRFFRLSNP